MEVGRGKSPAEEMQSEGVGAEVERGDDSPVESTVGVHGRQLASNVADFLLALPVALLL